jgi:hypothetical protein
VDGHCHIEQVIAHAVSGPDFHHLAGRHPPYTQPCNADHDLVPDRVNPAIATAAALCAVRGAGYGVSLLVAFGRAATDGRAADEQTTRQA